MELVAGDAELVERAQALVDERGDRDRHSVADLLPYANRWTEETGSIPNA